MSKAVKNLPATAGETNCSLNVEAQNTDMYEQIHGMNEVKR